MIEVIYAAVQDADSLARIMDSAWRSAFSSILSPEVIDRYTQPESCRKMFIQIISSGIGTLYMVKEDGHPMGLLYLVPENSKTFRIEGLLTVPEAWGRGIGTALMERAVSDAVSSGAKELRVWPFEANLRARRFYEKWGFSPTGSTRSGDAPEMEYVRRFQQGGLSVNLEIHQMRPEEYDQKAYVHWKSWQETYSGLMDGHLLANQTLEKCQNIARRWPQNTLVAVLDGRVIGFACYVPYRGDDLAHCGEVQAIYVLKEAQGLGIGRKLMDAALKELSDYNTVVLWVLKGNNHAIGFYEHYGFHFDGTQKTAAVGTELRMVFQLP